MREKYIKAWRCSKCNDLKPTYEFKYVAPKMGEQPRPKVCKECKAASLPKPQPPPKPKKIKSPEVVKAKRAASRRAWNRRYREANAERARAAVNQWRKRNRDKVQTAKRNRRAILREAEGRHTHAEVWQMYEDQQGLCAYCETPLFGTFHVDHIIPVTKGGRNDWTNLAVTCPLCNMSKSDRTVEDFMAYLTDRL